MTSFIKRRPVEAFYLLAFTISWGAIFLLIAAGGIPETKEQLDAVLPIAIVAVLCGPSVSALLLTGLIDGRAGFRALRSSLLVRHVGGRWYAVALLAGPLALAMALLVLRLVFPEYPPALFAADDTMAVLLMGLTAGLIVGICEELGWTGFALPRLRLRFGILATGMLMGVLWGTWHVASHAVLASGVYSAPLTPVLYVVLRGVALVFGPLLAFRVLMVWVYDRTGSLLVAMLMHFSLTSTTIMLEPVAIPALPLLAYDVITAIAVWLLVALAAIAGGGRLERGGPAD